MNIQTSLVYGTFAVAIVIGLVTFYRLRLHPLADVPGPKFAAVSRLYEWYSDCIQPGIYCWKIKEWHKKYGPIVRVGPNEVHIDDPDYYDVLYSPTSKLDKDPWYYAFTGDNESAFGTVEYDIHRIKRGEQNPFFSRQNVDKSAPILNRILENMFAQFETFRSNGKPLQIRYALKSFATDVVCEYCFPSGMEFVKSPNFAVSFHDGQETFIRMFPWFRHVPLLAKIMMGTPKWMTPYLDQGVQTAMSFVDFLESQVRESIRQSNEKEKVNRKTIIRQIYESSIPAQFRTKKVLEAEALALVAAGTATTSRIIEASIFHILSNPLIAKTLTQELRTFQPPKDNPKLLTHRDLEQLPYLTAIFLETQRMIPATYARFPRIIPPSQQNLTYQSYKLPSNTIVSMSNWYVLLSSKIWGESTHTFDPSRWLENNPSLFSSSSPSSSEPPSQKSQISISQPYKTKMNKYLPSFGRGSRNCVGQNLAIAEYYVVIGNLFRLFDLELFETDQREIEVVQDCFVALTGKGTVGVRVILS